MFDQSQPSFIQLGQIYAEQTKQIVAWTGAGLSRPAGIPTWNELRVHLCKVARNQADHQDEGAKQRTISYTTLAENEADLWLAFDHLHNALLDTAFRSEIKMVFAAANSAQIPLTYSQLWRLDFHGVINLNLDGLATRAANEQLAGKRRLIEFSGCHGSGYAPAVLAGGNPFIMNLHGVIDDDESWVFTREKLNGLFSKPAVIDLIETIGKTRAILFLGISADDTAAGGYLHRLQEKGIRFANHFWLTDRNDRKTLEWADKAGIRIIHYQAADAEHRELWEALNLLAKFSSKDDTPPPVIPQFDRITPPSPLDPPDQLRIQQPEEIREKLSLAVANILQDSKPDVRERYEVFCSEYAEAIWSAWAVNTSDKNRELFGYHIQKEHAKGAFGRVYSALAKDGKRVAIKVLHADVRDDQKMMDCFRRGVRSMKLLHEAHIEGMVPYLNAWEIPACAVMEFIDGPNLDQAVEHGNVDSWGKILNIGVELARIIRDAHLHPQRVLHRDIRPANIMLKDYDTKPGQLNVMVLDFDLSWHRDAVGQSVDWSQSVSGFTAPELATTTTQSTSRSAQVDSFGMGMTLYFMVSKRHPVFLQHQHGDWENVLHEKIVRFKCDRWKSLPKRYARLVMWATKHKQSERWDMTRIYGELKRLKSCVEMPAQVCSAELLAEEICALSPTIASDYMWDVDRIESTVTLRTSHTNIRVYGNENEQRVEIRISWCSSGISDGKNVWKYVKRACEQSCSKLKAAGWSIRSSKVDVQDAGIEAWCETKHLKGKVRQAAEAADLAFRLFQFS